jgi:hypothetical protein
MPSNKSSLTTKSSHSTDTHIQSLVFVHGLRGNPIESWKTGNIVWPRDLLPQSLPNVRVMTYGYDADVMNFFSNAKVSKSSIFQHSINLLEDLQLERDTPDEVRVYSDQRKFLVSGIDLWNMF